MADLEISLLPKQREILEDGHRFKVVCCGRRFGKSTIAAYKIIIDALMRPNGMYFIVSPTFPQTKIIWRMIARFLPPKYIKRRMEGELYIELINGSYIFAKSGDNPDSLRGEGLNGVVVDEAAMIKPEVWKEALRPALADKGGWSIFISCITKDSFILTDEGIVCMEDLSFTGEINQPQYKELSLFGLLKLQKSEFLWENAETSTIKVTVEGKYTLEGTHDHPILAKKTKYRKNGEWIPLKDIKLDHYVAIQCNQQIFGNRDELVYTLPNKRKSKNNIKIPAKVNSDFAYLCGLILGDGYINDIYFTVVNKDKEIIDFIRNNTFGLNPSIQIEHNNLHRMSCCSYEFASAFNQLGYEKVKAKDKSIPKKCLSWSKNNICALLSGLFDTDGHCYNKNGKTIIGFSSTSIKMINQVRMILLNLGIVTQLNVIKTKPTMKVSKESTEYQIIIGDQIGVQRFFEQIGFRIKRKQEKIIVQTDKVYGDRKRIYQKCDGYDIIWKRVKKIEYGKSKTYDFHIPNGHSFFSNGFISHNTPKGKNWFYELFLRGLDPEQSEYISFHYPTWENPLVPMSEIEEARKTLPEITFKQEFEAKFVEGGGTVFRGTDKVFDSVEEPPLPKEYYVVGVDLGRHEDFTVISVGKPSEGRQVYMERFNRTDWDYIKERIREVYARYNNAAILIDSTGYGDPIYEDLGKEGLNITGYHINSKSKTDLIENLQIMIESRNIHLIKSPQTSLELDSYSYELLPSGHIRYSAPKGFHDDIVIAVALMSMGFTGSCGGIVGEVTPPEKDLGDYDSMTDVETDWDSLEDINFISSEQD